MPTLRPPNPTPDSVQMGQQRWILKRRGVPGPPPLRYYVASLNFSGAVLTNTTRVCMAHRVRGWEALRQAGDKGALKEAEPGSLWECYWNSDMRIEWAQLHVTIQRAVHAAVDYGSRTETASLRRSLRRRRRGAWRSLTDSIV